MLVNMFHQFKRERIRDRVVSDVAANMSTAFYALMFENNTEDLADNVGNRVKDQVWASIPPDQAK